MRDSCVCKKQMLRSDKTVVGFALGRIAFGVGLLAAPGRVASGWLGPDAERPARRLRSAASAPATSRSRAEPRWPPSEASRSGPG